MAKATAKAVAAAIDAESLALHLAHQAACTRRVREALAQHPPYAEIPLENLLARLESLPGELHDIVRDHGGCQVNHDLFWSTMIGGESERGEHTSPRGELRARIGREYGSFEAFCATFEATAARHFGPGWLFLVRHPATSRLQLMALPGEDSPLSYGRIPLLGCDLWEHAWFHQYAGDRADWVHRWWSIIDWEAVEARWDGVQVPH